MYNIYFIAKHLALFYLSIFYNLFVKPTKNKNLILLFHAIQNNQSDQDKNLINLSEKKFKKIIQLIHKYKLKTELIKNYNSATNNTIFLTFDDGYKDFRTIVLPLLIKYKLKATLFVCPGELIDKKHYFPYPMLNLDDILYLSKFNFIEIGLHHYYHENISLKSTKELEYLIKKSLNFFDKYNIKIQSFSYPYGIPNKNIESIFKKYGIKFAVTGFLDYANVSNVPNFELPRQEINFYSTISEIRCILKFKFISFQKIKKLFH